MEKQSKRLILSAGFIIIMVSTAMQAQISPRFELTGYGNTYYNGAYSSEAASGSETWENLVMEGSFRLNDRFSALVEVELAPNILSQTSADISLNVGLLQFALSETFELKAGLNSPYPYHVYHNGVNEAMLDHRIIPAGWKGLSVGLGASIGADLHMDVAVMQSVNDDMIPHYHTVTLAGTQAVDPEPNGLGIVAQMEYEFGQHSALAANYYFSDVSGYWGMDLSATMHVMESYLELEHDGFRIKGAAALQFVTGFHEADVVDSHVPSNQRYGAYLEFGYDVQEMLNLPSTHSVILFTRNEMFNEHFASSEAQSPFTSDIQYTIGVNYFVTERIVVKADYQRNYIQETYTRNTINLGLTYGF